MSHPLGSLSVKCYFSVAKAEQPANKTGTGVEHPKGEAVMATEKFKALVHFMVHECQDNPSKLGAIRLNKALWYTDVAAFRSTGASITNEAYVKRKMGPVPAHILATIEELKMEGKLHVREPSGKYDARKFVSLEAPDPAKLSEDEKALARTVLSAVLGYTANAISEMTHDIIWDAADDGEEIPLYATLVSEQGPITEDVKAWARGIIEAA